MADVAQLIIDGECDMCRRVGRRLAKDQRFAHCRVRANHELGDDERTKLGLSREHVERSVALVSANGEVHYGADAIVALIEGSSFRASKWKRLVTQPLARAALDVSYRVVARHRHTIGRALALFSRGPR